MRPEFFSDETLAGLPDAARLFYIGLWLVADDGGWMEWRPSRIGALLYPYESAKRREANIAAWSERLVDKGRLLIYDCGCAAIPTLPRHQRISGKQSFAVREMHRGKHEPLTDKPRLLTDSPVTVGNGTVGNGMSEFQNRVPRPVA